MGSGSRRSDAAQTMVLAEFFADLFPAADFQFIKNIGDMFFDCRFGNIQFHGEIAAELIKHLSTRSFFMVSIAIAS